jgi:hypothetical protein
LPLLDLYSNKDIINPKEIDMATKKKAPTKKVTAPKVTAAKAPEPKVDPEEAPTEPAQVPPQERAELAYQSVLAYAQGVVNAAATFESTLAEVKAADPDGGAPSNPLQHRLRGVRALESTNRSTLAMVTSGQI